MEEYKLYRCTIIGQNDKYYFGKDVHNQKYCIAKNKATKNYKLGTDDTFYAAVCEEGIIFKKKVLHPITSSEYEKLVSQIANNKVTDEKMLKKLSKMQ